MKIKLTKEEQQELTDVVNALGYHTRRAKHYSQATRGLVAIRESVTMRVLLDHGVAQGRANLDNLEKGELTVSDIKIPTREELASLKGKGMITEKQRKKIIGLKK